MLTKLQFQDLPSALLNTLMQANMCQEIHGIFVVSHSIRFNQLEQLATLGWLTELEMNDELVINCNDKMKDDIGARAFVFTAEGKNIWSNKLNATHH